MKFKPLFSGDRKVDPITPKTKEPKKTQDIDAQILQTGTALRGLERKFKTILDKEIAKARYNKSRNVKNSSNYSRIGIAYYSLNMIRSVQERMSDIHSTRELYNAVNGLGQTLSVVNGLDGKIGRMDVKSVISGINKMTSKSSGASREMLNALSKLSSTDSTLTDGTPIEALVSRELIERLIDGEGDVGQLVESHEGLLQNTEDIMNLFDTAMNMEPTQLSESEKVEQDPGTVMDDISAMIAALK